ncbi:MAG: dihydroneopterin aldolase [Chromatocurvus sp.]
MSDVVFIRELRIDTVIGVYDWERQVQQSLLLDIEMSADTAAGAATDDVADALDYSAVADRLRDYAAGHSVQLVETLAERFASLVRDEFGVSWVRLRLCKPGAVAGARDVGVIIERGERHG